MNETRIAAFVEYVLRPLSEDWKRILEELRALNIGLTQETAKQMVLALGVWHLVGEVLRGAVVLGITWMVCQAVVTCWSR